MRRALLFLLLLLPASTLALAAGQPPQNPGATAVPAPGEAFDATQVAEKLLGQLRDGLQERNSRKMLGAFDRERMRGYLAFQDQVEAFFAEYQDFRVYIRLESTSFEADRAVVTANFQLEATPRYNGPETHREAELTFELTRGEHGWKITAVTPRNFFS